MTRLLSTLWAPVLAVLSVAVLGCSTSSYAQAQYAPACAAGHGDDCWLLGEMWMRKASVTYIDGWDLLVDREKARDAYQKGCAGSSLRACTALVERHLLDDHPPQRDAMIALVHDLRGKIRTDAQVEEQDEAIRHIVVAGYYQGKGGDAAPAGGDQGGGAGKSAGGFGFGMTQDLACTSAKLQAAQTAGCANPAASISGASCECNKAGPQIQCNTRVTCAP
jgi:hypothetical protein